MKPKLLALLVLLVISFSSFAQEDYLSQKIRKNIVKTNLTDIIYYASYHLNASYERSLTKHTSFDVGFAYNNPYGFARYDILKLELNATFRYYFSKKYYEMNGFYLAPSTTAIISYNNKRRDLEYLSYNKMTYKLGINAGYQWQLNKRWLLDINSGLGKHLNLSKDEYYINFNIGLGYKF
jgi:hypothetical protein